MNKKQLKAWALPSNEIEEPLRWLYDTDAMWFQRLHTDGCKIRAQFEVAELRKEIKA